MEKRLIIVDVSSWIFRAFYAIRVLHTPEGVPVNAVRGVLSMFLKLFSKYRPTHILIAKDRSDGSFRNELYSEYKANRSAPPEELKPQFEIIDTMMRKMELPITSIKGYEADDIIGSACVQWKNQFDEILIASGDKDLMQFVEGNVKMLDTMKDVIYDEKGVFEKMGVYPNQVVDFLSMIGDASDNIPGMKGIGKKGAADLLAEYKDLDTIVKNKDKLKGKRLTTAFNEHLDDGYKSRELINIVQDLELGHKADETSYKFYPTDDLVDFLKSLSFKTILTQLENIKYQSSVAGEMDENIAPEQKLEVINVDNKKSMTELKKLIKKCESFSFSTEYDSRDLFKREIAAVFISFDGEKSYYVAKEFCDQSFLASVWEDDKKEVITEHAKRDYFFARVKGINFQAKTFDIIQAHFVAAADQSHRFDLIAKEYLGMEFEQEKKATHFDLSQMDLSEQITVGAKKAQALFKLSAVLKDELKEKELLSLYKDIDGKLIPILAKIEHQGVILNKGYLEDFEEELSMKISDVEALVQAETGQEINLNSPKQVAKLLFEDLELPIIKKTKTGASTDSEVMEELTARNLSPVPEMILKYREYGKIQSTYVKALPLLVQEETGKLHTHFNQHVASTGRLSSNNPNLQNIPVRSEEGKKVRKAFMATPGNVLLTMDYSQVELRLLAHFSQDPTLVKSFKDNIDIHSQTASEVLGIALKDVTSNDRSIAKAVNFGLMYGQSSFGLAKALKISRKEAKDYITKYFERFGSIKAFLDSLKEECEKTGYAKTFHGRKRYLPDIKSSNRTVKSMAERMAVNSPIQGTAADIIKLAMIKIDEEMTSKNLGSKMILQVHDELIFDVVESELDQMKELVKRNMENVVDLKVPLNVDVGIGVNWYDLK